jgi:chromosome segregation ATPase
MNQRAIDVPEEVLKFAPKERPRNEDPTDQSGLAIVAMLQKAADLSNDNCDRAMALAHRLSVQLRAAEDQINQLQAQNAQLQDRAARAETWLAHIQKEIEQKLIAPRTGRPKPTA